MKVYFDQRQLRHDPQHFLVSGVLKPSPEVPARAETLLAAAKDFGLTPEAPKDHGLETLERIHDPRYLTFLEGIFPRWQRIEGGSAEVVPNVHPRRNRKVQGYPLSAVGQAGFHQTDTACPISAQTWESAYWSAQSAIAAGHEIGARGGWAYALCRPPGHHAYRDAAGGFCFLGNAGAAAQGLRASHARVAILDVDLHHGNGTQDIFYERGDVLTVSLHAHPERFYPFFWGYPEERGEGPGEGFNLNLPLERGTGDQGFLDALAQGCQAVTDFAPGALVVALGLDAHEGDPLAGLAVTTAGFREIGRLIAGLKLPSVLVQEGGYLTPDLGPNLVAFLEGFSKG